MALVPLTPGAGNQPGGLTGVYANAQKQWGDAANVANGTADAQATQGTDQANLSPQARYDQASQRFGESLAGLTDQQRADVRGIYQQVNADAEKAQKEGRPFDRTAQFPLRVMGYANNGLVANPGDMGLARTFNAGNQFIDAYAGLQGAQK